MFDVVKRDVAKERVCGGSQAKHVVGPCCVKIRVKIMLSMGSIICA